MEWLRQFHRVECKSLTLSIRPILRELNVYKQLYKQYLKQSWLTVNHNSGYKIIYQVINIFQKIKRLQRVFLNIYVSEEPSIVLFSYIRRIRGM